MGTTSLLNSVLSATSGSSSTGIDVTDAVNAILYADRAPERAWQAQQAALASQTTAINQLRTQSATLTEQLNSLQDPNGALDSVVATSSSTSIVTASAVAGTAVGNHTVEVDSLASTGSAYSSTVASSSSQLASGSFTLTVGSGTPTTISFGSGSVNTLDQLAASINGQSLGVIASVVTDSSGSRLAIVSTTSGAAADFSLSSETGLTFTKPVDGSDAKLIVDGVPITSASNTVKGAITGVTLNLQGYAQGTAVNLNLAPDTDAISQAVSGFVTAYNAMITNVNSQFTYDSGTQTAGPLATDSSIRSLQSDLLNSTNYAVGGTSTLQTLDSLGVTTNADGTLSVDSATLSSTIANNPSAVQTFFQGDSSNGFVNTVETTLNNYADPTQGAFTVDLQTISSENTDLTNQTSTLELYLATQQTQLTAEYNQADIALSQLPQTLKQIDALLNPPNSSSGQ